MDEPRTVEELEKKLIYNLNLINELIKRTLSYDTHPKTKALEIDRLLEKGRLLISMYKAKTRFPLILKNYDKSKTTR